MHSQTPSHSGVPGREPWNASPAAGSQECSKSIWKRIALLAILTILTGPSFAQQSEAQQSEAQQPQPSELSSPSQVGEGSLLYRSGASGQYQSIPLLHTDAAIDVRGLVASATVTQQYANSSAMPVEAIYVFPLPHDAAVYDMEIRIGNRVIKSVVREREEAKRVYTQAKSEGKRAALLEQERPNIFTASVANIMPGDHIDVRMRYVQPLRWEAGKMRMVFPMVVGPRYIPGTQAVGHLGNGLGLDTNAVPDASRITPFVRNPDSRSGHDISVSVDLDPGFDSAIVQSISHQINVRRLDHGRQRVELATGVTIPNKDFILEVQNAESKQPRVSLFLSPTAETGETHFLLAAFPPSAPPKQRMPMEMLYMIDVSGSMEGTSIEQARGALLQALDTLMPTDRFGILAFSSGYGEFAAEPLPATADNLAAARHYVQNLQAGGGTEMLPALLHLMRKPQLPAISATSFFLPMAILAMKKKSSPRFTMIWATHGFIRSPLAVSPIFFSLPRWRNSGAEHLLTSLTTMKSAVRWRIFLKALRVPCSPM